MAASETQNGEWKKRETFGSAMVQVIIVGVVLAGAVGLVVKRGTTRKEIGELMKEARSLQVRGNPADLRKSLTFAEAALQKDANAPDPIAFEAAVYTELWMLHREPGAEAKAKELLERARRVDAHTEDRYGAEALHLVAAGKYQEADAFVEAQLKKGASAGKLFYAKAQALKALGNLQLSHTGYTMAMDKAWKDPTYSCAWGETILEEGTMGSIDAFNKALGSNPECYRARLGLALSRVQRKDRIGEAEAIVKEVLGHDTELSPPLKARALAVQAAVLNIQNQPDQAISMADQALALNPDDAWALFAKANALSSKKDAAAAVAYDAVLARARTAPTFYFEGAQRLQAAGNPQAAMALLDKYEATFKDIKNQSPDGKEIAWLSRDDKYWLVRGDLLREAGKLDEAMAMYDKAITAHGVNLGRAYYAKGSVFVARKEFDKAAEVLQDITPPDGTGLLAEAYQAMGDVLFAKKDYGPSCQNYAYALTRMKALQAPRDQMNQLLTDVEKKLKVAGQGPIAKFWMEQAKPLIQ